MPQMYWLDIGSSVGTVYRHTYTLNRVYTRPILPLGQTDASPTPEEVRVFRGLAVRYEALGIAWWDYAWTSFDEVWPAVSGAYAPSTAPPLGYPTLSEGSGGDDVLWMQEHLAREYPAQLTTGLFGPLTLGLLRAFQLRHGLAVTGRTDAATWRALLRVVPVVTPWSVTATSGRARAGMPPAAGAAPQSAALPARAFEIPEIGSARAPIGASHREPR
jgi:hypothetical protein